MVEKSCNDTSPRLGLRVFACNRVQIADLECIVVQSKVHTQADPPHPFQVKPAVGIGDVRRTRYQVAKLDPPDVPLAVGGNDRIGRDVADIRVAFPEEDPNRGPPRTAARTIRLSARSRWISGGSWKNG